MLVGQDPMEGSLMVNTYQATFEGDYIGPGKLMTCQEVFALLEDLVACPSVFGEEYALGRLLARIGADQGLKVEVQPVADRRDNILMTLGAPSYLSGRHGLLLHGHYDTVPALDMEDAFDVRLDGGRLRARGVVDQKGGLTAALAALIAMKRLGKPFSRSLCLAAVVDEESEHRGSCQLASSGIRADYAIVTEPTHLHKVEFGCRGSIPLRIRVEGKTAHAGNLEEGINAIEKALPVLEGLFALDFQALDLGELGTVSGSLCVSIMEAGTGYNNVPHEAVIWMDRRIVPGEDKEFVMDEIQAVLDRIRQQDPSFKAVLEVARPDWSWAPIIERGLKPALTPPDSPLFSILQRAAYKSGVGQLDKAFASCYYDMDFLVNDLGIPSLVWGPGDGRLNHTAEEAILVDEVCQAADLFCHVIQEICL